jgi:hypothetical protein
MSLYNRLTHRPEPLSREETVRVYHLQIKGMLEGDGPDSPDWDRLVLSVRDSDDREYLSLLRTAAQEVVKSGLAVPKAPDHPTAETRGAEQSLQELLREIDARLRRMVPDSQ